MYGYYHRFARRCQEAIERREPGELYRQHVARWVLAWAASGQPPGSTLFLGAGEAGGTPTLSEKAAGLQRPGAVSTRHARPTGLHYTSSGIPYHPNRPPPEIVSLSRDESLESHRAPGFCSGTGELQIPPAPLLQRGGKTRQVLRSCLNKSKTLSPGGKEENGLPRERGQS